MMRGFLVLFDTQPGLPRERESPFATRLAEWERQFGPACLRSVGNENCRFSLFTANKAIPAEFNQKVFQTPGQLLLWVGPRVDMTPDALLQAPLPSDLSQLAAAIRASPASLDTAVCLSYRSAGHELIVKTDLLNSTYVYWTRFGRWLLLSNSSLMLARLTRAQVNWDAASEFLASGSIYGNASLYTGIRTLKPSTVYAFKDGSAPADHEYWSLAALPFNSLPAREACDLIVRELDTDFDTLNASGKTFILDLTGGYDSRTNLGFALRRLKKFETTVSGRPGDEDVVISSALARHFGLKHKVIPPAAENDAMQAERLGDSVLLTDLEYNILEYSGIHNAQTQFDSLVQPSIHGSGGGDIARNIILRREFYDTSPDGNLVVEPLIAQRFSSAVPAVMSRADLPIADWATHMRGRIAEYDAPHVPAFARLDIIYLRMRMQFWQGRIASSTNRFRASFSPWTNRRVMETMLITRWRDKRHQMLSRLFLRALHPDLPRFVVARGEPGGPDIWSALYAGPARLRYYGSRLWARTPWSQTRSNVNAVLYERFAPKWEDILANLLRPEAVPSVTAKDHLALRPHLFGRLLTLANIQDSLRY